MKAKTMAVIVLGLAVLNGYAQVISVNFCRTGFPATQVDEYVFPGVVTDLAWENIKCSMGVGVQNYKAHDVDGTKMAVSVTGGAQVNLTIANDGWKGMANYVGIGGGWAAYPTTVTLSSIPYNNYYVIVYVTGYNGKAGSVSDGILTKYFKVNPEIIGTLVESTDTDPDDGIDNGSYVIFGSPDTPMTSGSVTLTLTPLKGQITAVAGVQVVEVPLNP